MSKVSFIIISLALSTSSYAADANRCEAIFDDSKNVVEELARLRVDSENNSNQKLRKTIFTLFEKKSEAARKAGIDLSELPKLVEQIRNQGAIERDNEKVRREEVQKNEKRLVAPRWNSRETIPSAWQAGDIHQLDKILVSPGGSYFTGLKMSNFSVVVRNSQTNSITQKLSYSSSSAMIPIEAVAFGSDEKTVVTSRRDQDQLDIWDIQTGQIINGIKFPTKINDHDHPVTNVAIAKNGNVIAVSTYKKVLVFESRTGKVLVDEEIISESGRVVDSLDFNDNGRFLIATSGEKKSVVFDLTAKKTISLIGHYGGKKSISFNSSGDRVLTSLSDGTVILWDTQTGQEIRRFNVSDSSYQRVAFVPDAEDFFIVVGPMEVSLWHVGSEQKIATLANHSLYSHRSIGFSPDGENLYFGGTHGEIFHWKRDRAEE